VDSDRQRLRTDLILSKPAWISLLTGRGGHRHLGELGSRLFTQDAKYASPSAKPRTVRPTERAILTGALISGLAQGMAIEQCARIERVRSSPSMRRHLEYRFSFEEFKKGSTGPG
jgi:hypothetical protein